MNFKSGFVFALFAAALIFPLSSFPLYSQNSSWLWPVTGYETGRGLIGWPQQEMDGELNFDKIFISAPEGTEVVCPADGTVSFFSVGFNDSMNSTSSYHFEADNFDAIFQELARKGENEALPVPAEYLGGTIMIRTDDGRTICIYGLSGDIPLKTGMRLGKGDAIGKVKYAYHKIKEPHIMLSVTGRDGAPDDPMSPFGLKSTFVEPGEPEPAPEWLTREQAEEDFSILMEAYRECFPQWERVVAPERMRAFEAGAAEAFKEGIGYPEFYGIVYASITSRLMHDSHIRLRTPSPGIDTAPQKYVPNIIHGILGDTVFVRHATEKYREHLGKRIVSMDGMQSGEIIGRSRDMVSGYDEDNESVVERLLLVRYWYLYGSVDVPRTVEIVLEDGTVIEDEWVRQEDSGTYYPQMTKNTAQYRRMAASASGKFGFDRIDDSTVLFRLGSFDLTDTDLESIAGSLAHYRDVPNMIIDVRYNAGGDDAAVRKVASYFLNGPSVDTGSYRMVNDTLFNSLRYSLNYYEMSVFGGYGRREGKPGFYSDDRIGVIIPDSTVNYGGRLYVLADETSNSAATLFPSILSRNRRAVIVGRETGSGYHYITGYDYARIMLPNSRIVVQIPLVKYVLDDVVTERYPAGRGLLPDYEVPLTYEEIYTSCEDPVLEKALDLINERKIL